mmetsp:Transcript_90238/g.255489  ORF Transcript_90238/g.255489 Transcript_90238/m.255489 type:complete len:289 (+) Transcript_90238:591-1457(+)
MAPAALRSAPGRAVVPAGGLRHLRSRSAEESRRRTIPAGLRDRTHLHVGVHVAGHLAARSGILARGALVVLVGLVQLAAGRGSRVGGAACLLDDSLVTPVVLVARIILDGLLHALCQECRNIHKPITCVIAVAEPQLGAANPSCSHQPNCLNHVWPRVDVGLLPAVAGVKHEHTTAVRGSEGGNDRSCSRAAVSAHQRRWCWCGHHRTRGARRQRGHRCRRRRGCQGGRWLRGRWQSCRLHRAGWSRHWSGCGYGQRRCDRRRRGHCRRLGFRSGRWGRHPSRLHALR